MSLKPGQNIGQYVVIEPIGRGGMATVFRASQPSLSRQVAIKVLPEFFADDPTFHERFRQEAMAIAALRHPNILTVFDSGDAGGLAYIVMEFVDGGTLADRLGTALSVDDCLRIAVPIAAALDYAHARGMVHRDVKPGNILIAADGTPILSDFGLARMAGSPGGETVARLTVAGTMLGTPEYMAPEQVSNANVGPAADVYALAVTLYEMLTGSVPHAADTPVGVLMARLNQPLPLPRDRNPAITEAVQDVLVKGLAKEPADRYPTAGQLVRALETAGRASVPAAVPAPVAPAAKRSRGTAVAVVTATAVLALAIAGIAIWSRNPADRPQADPVLPTAPAAPPAATPLPAPPSGSETARPTAGPPTVPPAPVATAQPSRPTAPTREDGKRAVSASGPAHGRLLYSLGTSAAEMAATPQPHPEDTITVKDGGIELTGGSDAGAFAPIPVSGIGDFVAILRFAASANRPFLNFRFHVTPTREAHILRIPVHLRLSPPLAGSGASGSTICCQPFDLYRGPLVPGGPSLLTGAPPYTVPAGDGEEHTVAVAAQGPLIVVWEDGKEIARVSDAPLGPGGMSLSASAARGMGPGVVRLRGFDLYEPPAERGAGARASAPALPPHGRLLYELGPNAGDLARLPQRRAEDTIVADGQSLRFTAGSDGGAAADLPMTGVADFVAVLKFAALIRRPILQLRFHRTALQGGHVVQLPAYLRVGPPDTGARPVGAHPCCQEFEVYLAPPTVGAPTLFNGPELRLVPAAANEEQEIAVSVIGPSIVVYASGREIARATAEAIRPGGLSINVLPRGRGQVPAVLKLSALAIYEAPAAR